MEKYRFKILISILAGFSVASGALLIYLAIAANEVSIESLRNDGFFVYDAPIQLDEFSLLDHQNQPFTNQSFNGKWTLVFFGYTFCPDICPLTLASIKQFYDLLEAKEGVEDVQVVMVSVDPDRDTPDVLANYVRFFHPSFIGVTGEYARLYTVSRQMNIAFSYIPIDEENYLVTHNGEIMMLDPDGNNVGFFKAPADHAGDKA